MADDPWKKKYSHAQVLILAVLPEAMHFVGLLTWENVSWFWGVNKSLLWTPY